jgi:hypothetical protein
MDPNAADDPALPTALGTELPSVLTGIKPGQVEFLTEQMVAAVEWILSNRRSVPDTDLLADGAPDGKNAYTTSSI